MALPVWFSLSPRSFLGGPHHIYLNKPVARDPLTFRPPLVARDARAPRLLCDPISQEPITTQDLGSCDRFRPIKGVASKRG